jgi:hypothetical protein
MTLLSKRPTEEALARKALPPETEPISSELFDSTIDDLWTDGNSE